MKALSSFARMAASAIGRRDRMASGRHGNTRRTTNAKGAVSDSPILHVGADRLVGHSAAIRTLRALVRRLAGSTMPILVSGESGTGKELVARALHEEGDRLFKPFVSENCAAVPEQLFESLLFGHVRGAFTGADRNHVGLFRQAADGTLFLDEVGEMTLPLQAKLLRVLQEREVRPVGGCSSFPMQARVIAASNRELGNLVRSGRFRKDLYYRLQGMTIEIPPLRRRLDDVPPLAHHLLSKLAATRGVEPHRLSEEALAALLGHDWPGNVRELGNELERAVALAQGGIITLAELSASLRGRPGSPHSQNPREAGERQMIERALLGVHGSISRAARQIGWNRQKLYRRMECLGVRRGFGRE
jgi:transcriptional regulator with PAS, ATPase and Fis domain